MTAADSAATLIVYACPVGELARQVEAFYATSKSQFGKNAAHQFPPHCTLLGFFHDDHAAIPIYAAALAAALDRARPTMPSPPIRITYLIFPDNFHGFTLESPWLEQLVADFVATVESPSRRDPLRPKTGLHLSLAYKFPPEQHAPLKRLARTMINPVAEVRWDLRLYEQLPNGDWHCHATWNLW